jgi:cAMP phosphodiesterase
MKIELLPSTLDDSAAGARGQHLTCFIIVDHVALDAGSLAFSINSEQRENIRDIVLTHAHLDHVAGLPMFIDDLFADLSEPVRVHATAEVIEVLERDIFNWSVYPRFSELTNAHGPVIEYRPFVNGEDFDAGHLKFSPVAVNHLVPASGFVVDDGASAIAVTGDTSSMDDFWTAAARTHLKALLIECAFPDELSTIAKRSHHMIPELVSKEIKKLEFLDCPIYIVNIKPMYRRQVIRQLSLLNIDRLNILEIGRPYFF